MFVCGMCGVYGVCVCVVCVCVCVCATRIATSYTAGIGVSWVWPIVFLYIPQNGHAIMVDFCHGHRVTHSLAVWSRSHRQLFGRSWSVAMVSALSTVCTEVTTTCTCVCVCVCVCIDVYVCACVQCVRVYWRDYWLPLVFVYMWAYACTSVLEWHSLLQWGMRATDKSLNTCLAIICE